MPVPGLTQNTQRAENVSSACSALNGTSLRSFQGVGNTVEEWAKRIQEPEHGKEFCEIPSCRHGMAFVLELSAALLTCTRAVQGRTDQHSVMECGGPQEALSLHENL